MKFGFILRRLSLTGSEKVSAEVTFERGLNVIAGPSDSGKSFIAHCLDYALGGGKKPKDIPQAEGYSCVIIDIEANSDGRVYTLKRSLLGGKVLCTTNGLPDRWLAVKHTKDKADTVSQFLLDLSGLGAKKVRTNERGKTRPLSFRDIVRLVIIDEETIIQEVSPALSGQHMLKTVESSVFRLLLTGTDDSSIIQQEDLKVEKGRWAGKVELLDDLLKATRARLTEFGESGSLIEEQDRLTQIENSIHEALVERNAAQTNVVPLQTKRRTTWTALKAVESKLAVLSELQTRFNLLEQQYKSDLRRLETIAEAGTWLNELKEERCPICGADSKSQHHEHLKSYPTPTDVSLACRAEANNISKLLMNLQKTITTNHDQVKQLRVNCNTHQIELNVIESELKNLMDQHVDVASKKVDEFRIHAETCRKRIEYLERIQELEELREDVNKSKKMQKIDVADAAVSTAQADSFCREVKELLREWHFPDLDHVSFSEYDQDIVISGHTRKSHGKGVRAITRAAFNLALLRLCIKNERPFPNFILLDSPLLVYEEPDSSELELLNDVKKHFWESMKSSFIDAQVIIIENSHQLPDNRTLNGVKVELFTGNKQGRMGFIPT